MDKILDKLYLGDLNGATNYQMLKKNVLSFVNFYRESLIFSK